ALLLSFGCLKFCLSSIGCRFCLALYLFSKALLLGFCIFAFCLSIGCRFCLPLFLLPEPLLIGFLRLVACFGVGDRLCLVRARRLRLLLRPRRPRPPPRIPHLVAPDPNHAQQPRPTAGPHAPPAQRHQSPCHPRHKWPPPRHGRRILERFTDSVRQRVGIPS